MTTPEPQAASTPEAAEGTFTAQLLAALRNNPEVENAVLAAVERAELQHPHRLPPGADTSRMARRAE